MRHTTHSILIGTAALIAAGIAAFGIYHWLGRGEPWLDDWSPPPGYAEMLADLSAGRAQDGERRFVALSRRHRSPVWERRGLLALGIARLRAKEYKEAAASLEQAIRLGGPVASFAALKRGEALTGARRQAEAVEILQHAAPRSTDPVLGDDLAIALARAQATMNDPALARQTLEDHLRSARCRERARVMEAAARIAEDGGERARAVDLNRRIYLEEPRSRQAVAALEHLEELVPPPARFRTSDLEAVARRAQILADADDGKGALATWDVVLESLPSAASENRWRTEIAAAAVEARQFGRAYALLGPPPVRRGDSDRGLSLGRALIGLGRTTEGVRSLRAASEGQGARAGEALFLLATSLDQDDRDREALELFRQYVRRFPEGGRFQPALWRASWLSYHSGERNDAITLFQQLLELPGAELYHPASLYWLARAHEAAGRRALAADLHRRILSSYARDYYGILAAPRLRTLGGSQSSTGGSRTSASGAAAAFPGADGTGSPSAANASGPAASELGHPDREYCSGSPAPGARPRVEAGCELEWAGLYQEAEREYLAAATAESASRAVPPSVSASKRAVWLRLAAFSLRRGDRATAIERLKAAVPDYLGVPIDSLPRHLWEVLYPRPHWEEIERAARARRLDPALVCAIILQESAFNPLAVSGAGAVGLMQVLPETGADASRALRESGYTSARLFEPAVNIKLGTWHFSQVLGRFGGSVDLSLAAYNAGETRVRRWQKIFGTSEPTVFTEEIPYTETRLYVKRTLSHAAMYRAVYGP